MSVVRSFSCGPSGVLYAPLVSSQFFHLVSILIQLQSSDVLHDTFLTLCDTWKSITSLVTLLCCVIVDLMLCT